jgi:hypothetical protein|nr:MAG TPA: hypothetical protein [Caudoviricetes sp.]
MKHYKLLKDTLTVKAGSIFEEKETFDGEKRLVQVTKDGYQFSPSVVVKDINNFDEWFEEIHKKNERWRGKLGETYWFLSDNGSLYFKTEDGSKIDNYRYRVGNYFKTIEEARTYKKYLLARQVLLGDAEGGKWERKSNPWIEYSNWCTYYNSSLQEWGLDPSLSYCPGNIYFKTEEALKKSLKEHKEQWEIVRKYEMWEM